MPLRKWLILHVNKGKTNQARVGLQDKIWKRMKTKSIVPVPYLLEAIQLQKEEEEEEEKSGNRQWQKPECYKNDDNMEGNYKQIRKSSQGKEYSYVWVLRTTVDKINNWKQASIK